jgi:hypothetical protein
MGNSGGARLAGFVMGVLGAMTYGTTSPFGLMLSAEKMWEKGRGPGLRMCDWIGIVLSVPGCFYLPFFLIAMWDYSLIGPQPVLLYLAFLMGWSWHRVRIVWGWPKGTSPEREPAVDETKAPLQQDDSTNAKPPSWVSRRQTALFLIPPVAIALVGCWLWLTKPETFRLLWADTTGQGMALKAALWGVCIGAACVTGAMRVNKSAARAGWSPDRETKLAAILLAWTFFGCLPALMVVLVGPSAIQITSGLNSGIGIVKPD